MKRILILGAGGSASTNFIKSLHLSYGDFRIIGADSSKYHIKLSHAHKNYLIPGCFEPEYISVINSIIDKEKIDFLHCQPDNEVEVISENRKKINTKTFLPEHKEIMLSHDKLFFNERMLSKEIPVPASWDVNNEDDLMNAFIQRKTEKLWLRSKTGAGSLAALPVWSVEQSIMWIEYWEQRGIGWGQFMISEFLPGKDYAFQSLWYEGSLVTSAARERIEYLFQNRMPSGQSSTPTVAKSVHNDQVNNISTKGIKALSPKPHGVYCVDLKENEAGIPCITEINTGRFFTTSLFFSSAGANMPYEYIKLGLGETIGERPKYNAVPENLYWIRQIDCGEKMVRENEI